MGEMQPVIFAAAGTYVQGAGVLDAVGPHLARLGERAIGVLDPVVRAQVEPALAAGCASERIAWQPESFPGECTEAAVDRLVGVARPWKPEMVIAAGGGKALDTGKLLAEMLRLRANPALVLVDTAVIARAPVRFLVAGMGDAIATWPEARTCAAGSGRTPVGGRPARAALALAELCYRTILAHGRQAHQDVGAGRVSEAIEAIVEANILLSGLGFESGGLAAAHSLYAGFSILPAGAAYLHGEKVAFGVVVQSILEDWPAADREALLEFYRDVKLPSTLCALGLGAATAEDLRRAAEVACRPGSHMHNLRRPPSVGELVDVLESLRG